MANEPTIEIMNEAIGIFMGGMWKDVNIGGQPYKRFYMRGKSGWDYCKSTRSLDYHEKWDELKPVIDEISEYILVYPEQVKPVIEMKIIVNIQAAHERVYQFCKWLNQQPQTNGQNNAG